MTLLGNLWKRLRPSRVEKKRARRLFMEPLESRALLATVLEITKTDNFNSLQMPVPAGEQNLLYNITVKNNGQEDATGIQVIDQQPEHTSNGVFNVVGFPAGTTVTILPPSGGQFEGDIDVLHAGDSVVFSFQVAVDSNADLTTINPAHHIVNTVFVTDATGATITHDNTPDDTTPTTTK